MSQVACHDAKPHDVIHTSMAIAARMITKSMLIGETKVRITRQKDHYSSSNLPLQVEKSTLNKN